MRSTYLLTAQENQVEYEFLTAVRADKISELSENSSFGFWVIDARSDIKQAQELLLLVRQQFVPNLYLRPVVFLISSDTMASSVESMGCDGVFYANGNNEAQRTELISKFELVNQWVDKLPDVFKVSDTDLIFRVLRLIVSRNSEIVPIMTAQSLSGFIYPLLEPIAKQSDSSFFHLLDFLEAQHLISGRFISHCYFCCQCHSAFLNFKEACPQCKSENIESDELIHHFKCAYVAEKSTYQQGGLLVCPKCDKELKHIGVDYDKPSLINHCNQCGLSFQEAHVTTECFNCHTHTEPEGQVSRNIKAYTATAIGKNAAIFGLDALFTKIISSKVSFFPEDQFQKFLDIEIERIKRYKLSESSLGFIKFIDIEKIYLQQGERAEQFFEELSTIFKSILRISDIVTAKNQSVFIIIMTETSTANAKVALERLIQGLSVLLDENLNYTSTIPFITESINSETDFEMLLEKFISNNVS